MKSALDKLLEDSAVIKDARCLWSVEEFLKEISSCNVMYTCMFSIAYFFFDRHVYMN